MMAGHGPSIQRATGGTHARARPRRREPAQPGLAVFARSTPRLRPTDCRARLLSGPRLTCYPPPDERYSSQRGRGSPWSSRCSTRSTRSRSCTRASRLVHPVGRGHEIVFINDGSRDGSDLQARRARRPRPRVQRHPLPPQLRQVARARGRVRAGPRRDRPDPRRRPPGRPGDDPPVRRARIDAGADLVSGWKKRRNDPIGKTCALEGVQLAGPPAQRHPAQGLQLRVQGLPDRVHPRALGLRRVPPVLAGARRGQGLSHRSSSSSTTARASTGSASSAITRFFDGILDLLTVLLVTKYRTRPLHFFGLPGMLLGAIGVGLLGYRQRAVVPRRVDRHPPAADPRRAADDHGLQFCVLRPARRAAGPHDRRPSRDLLARGAPTSAARDRVRHPRAHPRAQRRAPHRRAHHPVGSPCDHRRAQLEPAQAREPQPDPARGDRRLPSLGRRADHPRPPRQILELGCGEGYVLNALAEANVEAKLTGVELDSPRRPEARRAARRARGDRAPGRPRADRRRPQVRHGHDARGPRAHPRARARCCRSSIASPTAGCCSACPWEPAFRGLELHATGKNLTRLGNDPDHVNHWGRRGFIAFVSRASTSSACRQVFPWTMALAR